MAGSPFWKVYDAEGEYQAACKRIEDAAMLVAAFGGTIRAGHKRVVWTEGAEAFSAAESYDRVAEIARQRARGGEKVQG